MPQVEVDVQNIPDIIEAQLTLSYSRLSDLIRIIVDQGNSHDEEITGIHDDVGELRNENERLRQEIEALKARGSDQSLHVTVEFLKKEVERLSATSETHSQAIKTNDDAHTAEEKAIRELLSEQSRIMAELTEGLADTNAHVSEHENRLGLAEAFTELWGARPEQIFTMAAHTQPNDPNSDYEHTIEERTQYLHTLPAFAMLFDEVNVVRAMLQKQSAEAIATKTEMRSRQSSEVGGTSTQDAMRAVEALEARLQAIEAGRLPPLEEAVRNMADAAPVDPAAPETIVQQADLSGVEKDVKQLQDRLFMLEDRLRVLLGQTTSSGGDASEVTHAAFADLSHRVEWLEEVVEGLPGNTAQNGSGSHDAAAAAASAAKERSTPDGAPAADSSADAVTAAANGMSPVPAAPSPVSSTTGSQRPASASGKMVRPASGRAAGSLPPISPTHSAAADHNTPLTGAIRRSSAMSAQLNQIPQPVLDSLKAQEEEQTRDPRRTSRSISVAMEPEDGLRRRVAVLEENCAILEVNKADRAELQALEDAIRQALAQHQLPPLPATSSVPGAMAPRRPPNTRVSLNDNNGLGVSDGVVMRPRSTAGGRPMFVGSSAVYLRDGSTRTQVTVSPTRLSGTY